MPDLSKTFSYAMEGLSYTVTVYEDPENPGQFLADISVSEGAMDVNAIYFGDDDFSGDSEGLKGPLNMNGVQDVQWDEAVKLSDPGLGPEGEDKETYVTAGDQMTVQLDIDSLDDVDVFGIRATSTTTEEGSIKAVSEEEEDDDEPTFEKVGFGVDIADNGMISNGVYIFEDNLPEGEEGTFENYVNFYESQFADDPDYNITEVESVIFYDLNEETAPDGSTVEVPTELFRIDALDGGFQNAEELLAAYDDAVENGALDGASMAEDGSLDLLATLSTGPDSDEEEFGAEDPMPEDEELEEMV
ncbi:hypothetical protein SAMN06265173_10680 [Thalassovita litoralis]|uniref:Uncharacterized protein n=1 Tax=Thalassovita litoralis TaxID=1010611 RepID=A0A521CE42_9RHOB|nr:hypothetical protein [Thalassovita litoralis]SMO57693.1 hypothetical protein SAMN06265173_10680 [Thalassovita litoralis]